MSEEIKENEVSPDEVPEEKEEVDQEPEADDQESSSEKQPEKKREKSRKTWVFFLIAVIIINISVLGIIFASEYFTEKKKGSFVVSESDIDNDNLTEETLSPFFIPSVEGSSKGAIRIDLSAIWDRLSSIRYQKRKLILRNKIYDYINELAKEKEDLNEQLPYLENELGIMFRKSLGVQNLVIRIKEIRYI